MQKAAKFARQRVPAQPGVLDQHVLMKTIIALYCLVPQVRPCICVCIADVKRCQAVAMVKVEDEGPEGSRGGLDQACFR